MGNDKGEVKESKIQYLLAEVWSSQRVLYLYFLLNMILTLIVSITVILTPRYLIAELTGNGKVESIILISGIFFIVTAVGGYILSYIKADYELSISRVRYIFIEKIKEKIMRVRYENLETPKYLNEFWRVTSATSDIEFGVQGILEKLFLISANGIASIFYLGILGRLNILIVLLLVLNIYLIYKLRSNVSKYEVETSKKASRFWRRQQYLSRVMEDLAYGKDIRIYGLSNFLLKKLVDNQKERKVIDTDIQKHHVAVDFAESIFACVRDAVVYGYLIYCVLNNRLSIADFTLCFSAVATLTITLEHLFEDVAFVSGDLFRIEEMKHFLELPNEEEPVSAEMKNEKVPQADQYEITFEHVGFRYPGAEVNVYTDFNFTIKAGKKHAIVGINGAGKTTLVKLVTRLYDPTEGRILLNGTDIRCFDLIEYRKLLTVVFQDINLFAMSLKENITGTDGDYDKDRFQSALADGDLTSFYDSYGNNQDMQLTRYLYDDGVEVSGGERQKMGIARALYKDGDIIIFDEPTAALDAHAEYSLYHKLATLSEGKTLLFISHRLASTRFCDEIILIDKGSVVECGSHDELLAKGGKYYQMFTAQKKYYD